LNKTHSRRGARLALIAIVRPYPSVGSFAALRGSFRPFCGSLAALRGSFCCPFWAVFRRFSWLVYQLCESSLFFSLFYCLGLWWCSRWFVSGSVWVRSCIRRDLQQQRVFGRRWPWEFFPSRADLDYPPNDLGIDLSKLLLRSPFGTAWLSLPWTICSNLPTVCSGWTSTDVVFLAIYRMISKIWICVYVVVFVVVYSVCSVFVVVSWAPLWCFLCYLVCICCLLGYE
jgi:hypothetical protein